MSTGPRSLHRAKVIREGKGVVTPGDEDDEKSSGYAQSNAEAGGRDRTLGLEKAGVRIRGGWTLAGGPEREMGGGGNDGSVS